MSSNMLSLVIFCLFAAMFAVDCLLEVDKIIENLELVSPTDEGLYDLVNETRQIVFKYDLDDLVSNRIAQDKFLEEMEEVLFEYAYPVVARVPNSVIIPDLQEAVLGEMQASLQDILTSDKGLKIGSQQVDVTVPTTGVCANTYKSEIFVTASTEICGDLFGFSLCDTATMKLDGYSCNGVEADGWVLQVTDVDSDISIDGDDLLGKVIAIALKIFKVDQLIHSQLETNFDSVDFGKLINDQVANEVASFLDQFLSGFGAASNAQFTSLRQQIQNAIDQILLLKDKVNIDISIQPEFITFTFTV